MCSVEDTIDIDGQPVHYLKVGRGSHVLLFLTGKLARMNRDFSYQITKFDKDKYTIIAMDPVGRGLSKYPGQTIEALDYDFIDFETEVVLKFVKRLGLERFSILGRCNGGNLALRIAASNPEMVNKIVTWGSRIYLTEEMVRYDDKAIPQWDDAESRTLIEELGRESFDSFMNAFLEGCHSILRKNNGNISKHLLSYVKAKVLVLAGGKDKISPIEQAKYLCDHLEFSRLYVFPNGGHELHKKYNEEFREVVETFLDS